MKRKGRRLDKTKLLKFLVSFLILFYLLKLVDFRLLLDSLEQTNIFFLFAALFTLPLSLLIRAYSFAIVLNKDAKRLPLRSVYALTLIGSALNIFLPASSGDIAKAYYGYRRYKIKEELLSASLVDKFTSAISVFAMGTIAAYFFGFQLLSVLSGVLTILFLNFLLFPRTIPWQIINKIVLLISKQKLNIEKLQSSANLSGFLKFYLLAVSTLGWTITFLEFYFISLSFSVDISFLYIIAISPVITLASLFPLTASGLGSTEASIVYFFALIGLPVTQALLVALVLRAINSLPGIGGLLMILAGK